MKKFFSCFSPKKDPDNWEQNASTTAFAGSPRASDTADATVGTIITTRGSPSLPISTPASPSASSSTSTRREWIIENDDSASASASASAYVSASASASSNNQLNAEAPLILNLGKVPIQQFCFIQLKFATNNFALANFLGRGGFGDVFSGNLGPQNREVAVKRLNPNSQQGTREFVTEIEALSNAQHENIIQLIGYCAEDEHKLLVYELMSMGSLEEHLVSRPQANQLGVMDWDERVRIAYEIAKGVEYLHDRMQPHMIYRDLKCANILLGDGDTVKLSDFGCAKIVPPNGHVFDRTMCLGTCGHTDPKYLTTGVLTFKADVYSYGVVLLELVSGRKGLDETKPDAERSLVIWARRVFDDSTRFEEIVDPLLDGKYTKLGVYTLVSLARNCVHDEPDQRLKMSHIVDVLKDLKAVAVEGESATVRLLSRCAAFSSSSAAGIRIKS